MCSTKVIISRLLITISFSVWLSACDYVGGTRHFVELRSVPDMACIAEVLEGIPEISDIEVDNGSEGGAITITGEQSPDKVVNFSYAIVHKPSSNVEGQVDTKRVAIRFLFKKRSKADYTHAYIQQNSTPAQSEVDIVLPVIDKIERRLFEDCDIEELNNRVDRYCSSSLECPRREPLVPD